MRVVPERGMPTMKIGRGESMSPAVSNVGRVREFNEPATVLSQLVAVVASSFQPIALETQAVRTCIRCKCRVDLTARVVRVRNRERRRNAMFIGPILALDDCLQRSLVLLR